VRRDGPELKERRPRLAVYPGLPPIRTRSVQLGATGHRTTSSGRSRLRQESGHDGMWPTV